MSPKTICVDVSKGVEEKTLNIMTSVIQKNIPSHSRPLVSTISGPAIAFDMANGDFTAMNISSKNSETIKFVKKVLCNDNLRLKETTDIIGTEIAGSFKNIYAIAIGIADYYHWPMNTKAAIIVLAIKEMRTIIKKMGGREEIVNDLAGLGDLIDTAFSVQSRNRRFGQCLPKHPNKESATKEIGQIVEGVSACKITLALAKKYKIKMPLAQAVYQIVWKNANPEITLKNILKQSF
jgi:glycerol-3-phosphate dehydrogenase (NAD(P)+)